MPALVPLDNSVGALSIGVTVATMLFGINCMQSFLYFAEHSQKDGLALKLFVGLLWLLELVTAVLINHGIFFYTVSNWGDLSVINEPTVWCVPSSSSLPSQNRKPVAGVFWSKLGSVFTFVALMVQGFFAHRVYILGGRRKILPGIIIFLTLAQFAMGIGEGRCVSMLLTYDAHPLKVYTKVSLSFKRLSGGSSDYVRFILLDVSPTEMEQPYVMPLFGLELSADMLIAAGLIYYLRQHVKRSAIRETQHIIYVLIKYVVNTCQSHVFLDPHSALIFVGCAQVHSNLCLAPLIALWFYEADTLIFIPFVLVMPRVYSLSLLCSLNNRDNLREISNVNPDIDLSIHSAAFRTGENIYRSHVELSPTTSTKSATRIYLHHSVITDGERPESIAGPFTPKMAV
ncbi:unnamed protein product [Mycena citricolor]|uniref:DUF6534 domain-containing protein n=1 Tax=Mycena citricolor TaxID=2018698 RepID=A0AAD2H9F2_9AGAR|nr:unnamed protein product [Mycena citricolor]